MEALITDEEIKLIDTLLNSIYNSTTPGKVTMDEFNNMGGVSVESKMRKYELVEHGNETIHIMPNPILRYYIKLTPSGLNMLKLKGGFKEYLESQDAKEGRVRKSFFFLIFICIASIITIALSISPIKATPFMKLILMSFFSLSIISLLLYSRLNK